MKPTVTSTRSKSRCSFSDAVSAKDKMDEFVHTTLGECGLGHLIPDFEGKLDLDEA